MITSYKQAKESGFTLIEIIVSLALFTVVMTIAVGALLVLVASNRQLQNEQSVLSNLSFALDSMTREIRTGSNYYCAASNDVNAGSPGREIFRQSGGVSALTMDEDVIIACPSADDGSALAYHGIAFDEGGASISEFAETSRIAYFFDRDAGKIFRRLSGQEPESIVSDGLHIEEADFYVSGPDTTDGIQPKITVILRAYNSREAAAADPSGDLAYVIQTTVTQRALDI